ncbi:MAG: hypothetical protein OJF62_003125 [Pseudolabrys sp.]|jgi:hypothetical protein|nr:hypothetical protein [Pseudolabrys sp.]
MTPWLAREQFRWLRPDAHRFVRPDAARWQQSNQRLWQASRHWETRYNYNPSQPRVPRGNTGGGQWTDDSNGGGSSLGRIRLAGDIPTGDSPPEIPKERPPKSSERTSILKAAARRLAAGVAFDFLVARAPWILAEQAQIQTYNDSPRTSKNCSRRCQRGVPERIDIISWSKPPPRKMDFRERLLTVRTIWFGFHG